MIPATYPTGVVTLTASQVCRVLRDKVKPTTLRDWRARGHIRNHGRNRYDMGEILTYLDQRES